MSLIHRFVLALAAAAVAAGCATAPQPTDTIDRAIAAVGGEAALKSLRAIESTGTSKHWDPDQSHVAGGESRFAGESTFIARRDLAADAVRIEWLRKLVYPGTREYRFTEILAGGAGWVQGVDTTARIKQSQDSNPPSHAMSRFRAAAQAREMLRTSPTLLLQMKAQVAQLTPAADIEVAGQRLRALNYGADGRNFLVMFDAAGLPVRIRTMDYDATQGNVAYDLVLSDWRDVGGVKIAHRQDYQFNGRTVIETRFDAIRANPALPANAFEMPAEARAAARTTGLTVPYQWVLRRQFIGVYLDSDSVWFDPAVSQGLRLQDIAPGVVLTQGVTHNSMAVEMRDHLVVFDAPVGPAYTAEMLKLLAARFPGKPVRYVVMTHHHMDHANGARAYAAQGATLVVGAGTAEHYRRTVSADHSLGAPGNVTNPALIEVKDRHTLTDGTRRVSAFVIDNPHSAGGMIGFVEDAKVGYVTDLWSPGRDPLGDKLNAGQAAVVAGVQKAGIAPERFAGGHGAVANFADLLARAGK